MQKAQELSVLCNLDVNVSIYDRKINKVTEFATCSAYTLKDLTKMMTRVGKTTDGSPKTLKHKLIVGDKLDKIDELSQSITTFKNAIQSNVLSASDDISSDGENINVPQDINQSPIPTNIGNS